MFFKVIKPRILSHGRTTGSVPMPDTLEFRPWSSGHESIHLNPFTLKQFLRSILLLVVVKAFIVSILIYSTLKTLKAPTLLPAKLSLDLTTSGAGTSPTAPALSCREKLCQHERLWPRRIETVAAKITPTRVGLHMWKHWCVLFPKTLPSVLHPSFML